LLFLFRPSCCWSHHGNTKTKGHRILFTDGSRIVFRLSGTGVVGATIRMYLEKYEPNTGELYLETAKALENLVKAALELSKIKEFTGRDEPTVIT
jgi:phosphoglucomutase